MGNLRKLREILSAVPAGQVEESGIEIALAACWDELKGSNDSNMIGGKLYGRTEELEWNPPILSFKIERHGATVNGSSRAHRHLWSVNVENGEASRKDCGYRQLTPISPRYNAKFDAEEVVKIILSGEDDKRLIWKQDRREVKVDIATIVPMGGSNETEKARRKRFRTACETMLKEHGWEVVRYNVYRKEDT